jgi:hypothetical protein
MQDFFRIEGVEALRYLKFFAKDFALIYGKFM